MNWFHPTWLSWGPHRCVRSKFRSLTSTFHHFKSDRSLKLVNCLLRILFKQNWLLSHDRFSLLKRQRFKSTAFIVLDTSHRFGFKSLPHFKRSKILQIWVVFKLWDRLIYFWRLVKGFVVFTQVVAVKVKQLGDVVDVYL